MNDSDKSLMQVVEAGVLEEMRSWMQEFRSHYEAMSEMNSMLKAIAASQSTMAQSAFSMSETFAKSEDRQSKFEEKYDKLLLTKSPDGYMPIASHTRILKSTLLPTIVMACVIILGAIYLWKLDLNASLSNLEIKQQQTEKLIKDSTQSLKQEHGS